MMARRDRTDLTPGSALGVILAVIIGILGALLWVHWMACSQAAGTALCLAAIGLPNPAPWLRRWLHARRLWLADLRLAETERQIRQYAQLLLDDSAKLDALRERLIAQERSRRQLRRAA